MRRSETGRGTLVEVLDKFLDGSRDPRGGPGRVERPSERSGTGWGNPRGGPVRVGGPSRRSGIGWKTLGEVRDGLVDPRGVRDVSGDFP